jgi:hypothetical protein
MNFTHNSTGAPDLLHSGRIGRVAQTLAARRPTGMEAGIVAGDRRRPARSSNSSDVTLLVL